MPVKKAKRKTAKKAEKKKGSAFTSMGSDPMKDVLAATDAVRNAGKPDARPVGRPSEYGPHVLEITKTYFESGYKERGQQIPTKAGLGIALGGVSQQTIANWAAKNPEFVEALGAGLNYTELELLDGGLTGRFNPTFASLVAANTIRYRSKSDVDHSSADGSMTPKAPIDDTARTEAILRLLRPSN